jgi:hypothetical protein
MLWTLHSLSGDGGAMHRYHAIHYHTSSTTTGVMITPNECANANRIVRTGAFCLGCHTKTDLLLFSCASLFVQRKPFCQDMKSPMEA